VGIEHFPCAARQISESRDCEVTRELKQPHRKGQERRAAGTPVRGRSPMGKAMNVTDIRHHRLTDATDASLPAASARHCSGCSARASQISSGCDLPHQAPGQSVAYSDMKAAGQSACAPMQQRMIVRLVGDVK
jgi:hypothetical protein